MIDMAPRSVARKTCLLVYIICLSMKALSAARIGVMSTPHIGHYITMRNIASELLAIGHNVTMIVPGYIADIVGHDVPAINKLIYHSYTNEDCQKLMDAIADKIHNKENPMFVALPILREMNERILWDKELLSNLKNQHFDLFVGDSSAIVRPLSILPYRLGIPYIFAGVDFNMWTLSIPYLPSFIPNTLSTFTDTMVIQERMLNVFASIAQAMINPFNNRNDVSVFAPEMPFMTVDQVLGRAELWIINTNELIDYGKPTMPNVKLIGGLALTRTKSLSGTLKSFMDTSEQGVVLVTFGSVFPVRQVHTKKFLEAFRQLPYKIVWRVDDISLASYDSDHIYTSTWVPQSDVLAHNNTKLFLTHCGNGGQFEALYHGVPMLGMPLFGDQPYNAARMVSKGYGIALDYMSVTSNQLVAAITELILNTTYQQRIKRASAAYRSQLRGELPSAKAAFWIDHVVQYGGAYMRSTGQDMAWYEYLLLDVIAIFFACLFITVFLSMWLTQIGYHIVSRICRKIKQD